MDQRVIPTLPYMGRGLINHDPRSKDYRAVDLLDPGLEPQTKTWRRGSAYDQFTTPHCVAFTGKGILNTSPLSARWEYEYRSTLDTTWLYRGAQRRDEWEGNDYDGTSGLGLCRFMRRRDLISAYHWCFTLEEYLLTLSHIGPIGFGTWWKDGMWDVDSRGYLQPVGENVGGHEVELFGIDMEKRHVIGMNSWGTSWGWDGRFLLEFDALAALIAEDADGFVVTS